MAAVANTPAAPKRSASAASLHSRSGSPTQPRIVIPARTYDSYKPTYTTGYKHKRPRFEDYAERDRDLVQAKWKGKDVSSALDNIREQAGVPVNRLLNDTDDKQERHRGESSVNNGWRGTDLNSSQWRNYDGIPQKYPARPMGYFHPDPAPPAVENQPLPTGVKYPQPASHTTWRPSYKYKPRDILYDPAKPKPVPLRYALAPQRIKPTKKYALGKTYKAWKPPIGFSEATYGAYERDLKVFSPDYEREADVPEEKVIRPPGWVSPAQRVSEEILENIFGCLHELIKETPLPCVPIKGRDPWLGTLTNARLTNAEIAAYKTAVMRKMLYDYGRVCKSWWCGSQKGWHEVIIIGEVDAKRALDDVTRWIPLKSTHHLRLTLQMTLPSVHRLLRRFAHAVNREAEKSNYETIIPIETPATSIQTPAKPAPIRLRKLTILHAFEPEKSDNIHLAEFEGVLKLFAPYEVHIELFSGEKPVDVKSLDTVARALRCPWGYFAPKEKFRVVVAQDAEMGMLNAPEGAIGKAWIEEIESGKINMPRKQGKGKGKWSRQSNTLSYVNGRGHVRVHEFDNVKNGRKEWQNAWNQPVEEEDEEKGRNSGNANKTVQQRKPKSGKPIKKKQKTEGSFTIDGKGRGTMASGMWDFTGPNAPNSTYSQNGHPSTSTNRIIEYAPEVPGSPFLDGADSGMSSPAEAVGKGSAKLSTPLIGDALVEALDVLMADNQGSTYAGPSGSNKRKRSIDIESEDEEDDLTQEEVEETKKVGLNEETVAPNPWLLTDENDFDPNVPADRVAGFIYMLERRFIHLPHPELENLKPDERERREMWSELFGDNENSTREFSEADKKWCEIADKQRIPHGWIPPVGWKILNPLGRDMVRLMLETWLASMEVFSVRCHWMDIYHEIRKAAKKGKLVDFHYHFVPLSPKSVKRATNRRKLHTSPNPPLGSLKSLDNILMWDFRERPEKWLRKIERRKAMERGETWEEPPPTRKLTWAAHVSFDLWMQEKDRASFKGLGRGRPWGPPSNDTVIQAMKAFILAEAATWEPPVQAEDENWPDLQYFEEMMRWVTDRKTRRFTPKGRYLGGHLWSITRGATIDRHWLEDSIIRAQARMRVEKEIWLKREERWFSDPDSKGRRWKFVEMYMDHYLDEMGEKGRKEVMMKLRKKHGAKQLWNRCHWDLLHPSYPGTRVKVEPNME